MLNVAGLVLHLVAYIPRVAALLLRFFVFVFA